MVITTRTVIGTIQSDDQDDDGDDVIMQHTGDSQNNGERISLATRDRLSERSIDIQWKKKRAAAELWFRVVVAAVAVAVAATSNRFLSFPCVEGFQLSQIGTQSSYISAKLRLNVVPLKLAGDEMSSTELTGDDANTNTNNTSSTTNSNSPMSMNFSASESIGSLLLQMQKKEAELRLLNNNKSTSLLLSEDQALNLDASTINFNNATTTAATSNTGGGGSATAETTSQKTTDLFSWMRKPDSGDKGTNMAEQTTTPALYDDEIARELDDSVSIRITNSVKDVTILEPPEIHRIKPRATGMVGAPTAWNENNDKGEEKKKGVVVVDDDDAAAAATAEEELVVLSSPKEENEADRKKKRLKSGSSSTTSSSSIDVAAEDDHLPSLSRAEHYNGRIGRDMRHLAVSIASCIDSVEEWQLFCQQSTGGLEPLIECIREGAESIREGSSPSSTQQQQQPFSDDTAIDSSSSAYNYKKGLTRTEENFQVASSACRALRDLSGLSQDLAAVITDGVLRANASYMSNGDEQYSLMDDMCTILRQSDEFVGTPDHKVATRGTKRRNRLLRRRNKNQTTGPKKMEPSLSSQQQPMRSSSNKWPMGIFRGHKEARLQCKLYVTQLLLAMTCASDSAVDAIRSTEGLKDVLLKHSSYARKERRRRWMRYPGEKLKSMIRNKFSSSELSAAQKLKTKRRQPFIEAASLENNLNGRIKGTANQVLAAIGYNEWVPKIPGQKGLRILCLDGGGSRGMTSVMAMKCMVDSLGGMEIADCFDMVVGTSTGAIIAFLVGLNLETSDQAVERYDVLIEKIFTKSAFSTPMLLFTTASYDDESFMKVLTDILGDDTMLDSRANPAVPYVFAVTSKMSSSPTHVALFRNYNYNGGELPDPFVVRPDDAREHLDLSLDDEGKNIRLNPYPKKKPIVQAAPGTITPDNGSRHPGSFRALQKYALRASTAAPTVFKPVLMGGEMYCDGGIVASNPTAIAIHEARTVFPDVPIELVVSIGTGGFKELKSEPRIGWDGIIGQIVNSATDGEQIHHLLEDVFGDGTTARAKSSISNTFYMRFNPILGMPDEFPIDVTDPDKLQKIKTITRAYMKEPEQQRRLEILSDILKGRSTSKNIFRSWFRG